ncbi:HAD family hydrolase [Thalassotalea sediminis]|uniref:HAD family hydrolase n=1 Tax=Thalassotalea sediminis TaxID=1759089 RepID=UPI002573B1B1|nr:HAD-IA family hydrolase [Thalassotalea sediminis]
MKQYQLVIFDWDGTLMDSIARIISSVQQLAMSENLALPNEDAIKGIIGLSLDEALTTLFPNADSHDVEQLKRGYKKHYVDLDPTPAPIYDYAHQLLSGLKNRGKFLAVATGKAREGLHRVWQEAALCDYFDSSRCGCECTSKPHPDMIEQLLEEFNIAPENAVMIGDSILDMEMAKRAGVDSIGVTHGVHEREKLSLYSPTAIVNSLQEIEELIN